MKTASEALIYLFNELEDIREKKGIVLDELCRRLNTGRGSLEKRRRAMRTGNTLALVSSIVDYYHAIVPEEEQIVLPINDKKEGMLSIKNAVRERRGTRSTEQFSKHMGYKFSATLNKIELRYLYQAKRGTFYSLWKYANNLGLGAVVYKSRKKVVNE